jgi:hypothetical protein
VRSGARPFANLAGDNAVPAKLIPIVLTLVDDACPHECQQDVVKAVAQRVIRPKNVLDLGEYCLVEKAYRSSQLKRRTVESVQPARAAASVMRCTVAAQAVAGRLGSGCATTRRASHGARLATVR